MGFTHLHTHTEFSILDGSNKIKDYVKRVKELGMNAAAITDHGVMYGIIDFYKEAKKSGIKPILGCEVYVSPNSRFDREVNVGEDKYYHLVLLAENNIGYQNLMKIASIGFVDGYYYKPRVDMETLSKYHEGIIALSACLGGEVQKHISRGNVEMAKESALKYENCFGKGNFFLELQDHGLYEQRKVNMELFAMSKELGIELVATNDIHYTYATDAESHDALLCIQTGKFISDENRMRYDGGQYYVKSEAEMRELFSYAPMAIDNTEKIANRCNVEIEFGVTKMPKVEVPEGHTPWTYLNELCYQGLKERYPNDNGEIKAKLDYELKVIKEMGFVEYFIIVWDFINYARKNNIPVGPGRGSAAGSIVSYCLHITNIDPIKYDLIFERFLNPERVSMPDIDVDFCFERRQEVIDYVVRKYGADKVSQIITFGTLGAKMIIRDIGKVYEFPYAECDKLAKMIPNELNITIEKALEMNPDLKNLYDSDVRIKKWLDMAMSLEGLPRHTSMHAAGVVIYKDVADKFVPLAKKSDDAITTQFVMTTLEELGLLKMDFLGLRTLTVIKHTIDMIKKNKGIVVDIDNINYNDVNVLRMIGEGKCNGVFQLESGGMQAFMKELKPQSIEDIIAGISLYRPGPMEFIPKYIKGKNNPNDVEYGCKELIDILKPTYGCIVYQEQVMRIFQDLAGYTLGQSDNIRRAMSKKKQYVIDEERKSFIYGDETRNIKGCLNNGISFEVANGIYDSMVDFAKYAFNKSHAASYAIVSFQTAYLLHYYPVEYNAALMTSVIGNSNKNKLTEYILAAKNKGIKVLPPSVNFSYGSFTYEDEKVRFGLDGLKNTGKVAISEMIKERENKGKFKNFLDFLERTSKFMEKSTIESLIYSGAFDELGITRRTGIENYLKVLDSIKKETKSNIEGQINLFDMFSTVEDTSVSRYSIEEFEEYPRETVLENEKLYSGIYISGHPLDEYELFLKKRVITTLDKLIFDENGEMEYCGNFENVTIGGMITNVNIKYTKNNQKMAFIVLEDLLDSIEIIVFPKQYEKYASILEVGKKVFVTGTFQTNETKCQMLSNSFEVFENTKGTLWIRVTTETPNKVFELISKEEDGINEVVVYDSVNNKKYASNKKISFNNNIFKTLEKIYGVGNVKIT